MRYLNRELQFNDASQGQHAPARWRAQLDIEWVFVSLGHLGVALAYKLMAGVDIEADPRRGIWDWFWQSLPAELLRTDLLKSIWYMHAQPPLYNLFGGLFIKAFSPNYLQAIQYAYIFLGALLSGMLYCLMLHLTHHKGFALWISVALALNPALFLYEAYILYSLPTAFLVILSVFCLVLFATKPQPRYLYAFILVLNLLILMRSLYHLFLLAPALFLVALLAGQQAKRVLLISLVISLSSIGWYAKNYTMYGFFGSSSLAGQNLWHIVVEKWTPEQLQTLVAHQVLDAAVVQTAVFGRPSAYRVYGFTKTSPVAAIAGPDYHNINMIAISSLYQRNALRLIRYAPFHYLLNIARAYVRFCYPSSRYEHLRINRAKLWAHEAISSQIIQGQFVMRSFGSFLVFLLPASLLFYYLPLLKQYKTSLRQWGLYIQADPVMFTIAFLIVYTTLVSCLFEIYKNDRFKFDIEQLLWVFMAVLIYRALNPRQRFYREIIG